jgi:CheY-like chemotaxis protein
MKKVLIIDDDSDYRRLTGDLLRLHGWQVLEAQEGEEGVEMVRQHRPEIVLCDLIMPRCNGFLVCRKIRGDVTLRHTKIVVTSGRGRRIPHQTHQAARAGGGVVGAQSRHGRWRTQSRRAEPGARAGAPEILGRPRFDSDTRPRHGALRRKHVVHRGACRR